ncbi:hypothetical protein JW960_07410 [candidate division KSB1 bacterium]|nr:hypothetical protein [candidate division KSB1 bacterium]
MENREGYDFLHSLRGQFVISRALDIAIQNLESRADQCELRTLVRDMKYLQENVFPMYKKIQSI